MRFAEKASGWLIAVGLAIAVLLAFNYLDVFVIYSFRKPDLIRRSTGEPSLQLRLC